MTNYQVHLVNVEGRRAAVCVECYTQDTELSRVAYIASKRYTRFVILDAAGVQVYASHKDDATGAYLPHGYAG